MKNKENVLTERRQDTDAEKEKKKTTKNNNKQNKNLDTRKTMTKTTDQCLIRAKRV